VTRPRARRGRGRLEAPLPPLQLGPSLKVPDWLLAGAARGGGVALEGPEGSWSVSRLVEEAGRRAALLVQAGLAPGDRLAALLAPGLEQAAWLHAAAHVGAVWVPLHTRLAVPEAARLLADARPRLVLWDPPHRALAEAAAPGSGAELVQAEAPSLPPLPRPPEVDLGRLQGLVYTSGTTGRPKGAMLTFGNHYFAAVGSALHLGVAPGERHLVCLPLYHVGGMAILWRTAIYGQTARLMPRFDPRAVNRALDEEGVTNLSVVAEMLARMLDAREGRPYPPQVRAVLVGGGPAAPALMARARALGLPVRATYGLTETASQAVTAPAGEGPPGAAGWPLPGVALRLQDPGPDGVGEILLRGPTVTRGYWRRPLATWQTLRGGWLHTGDLGRMAPDGQLVVLSRRQDLIVSGGENVYPAEVEAVLLEHPAVAEAAVLPLADPRWGQVPGAILRLRPGARLDPAEWAGFLSARLASFKHPREVRLAPELPRTGSGKLVRHALPALWDRLEPAPVHPRGGEGDGRPALP
jgi:O-succinylbenzoic acid--CoA ligase